MEDFRSSSNKNIAATNKVITSLGATLKWRKKLYLSCVADVNLFLQNLIETHDSLLTVSVRKHLVEKLKPIFSMLNCMVGVSESDALQKQGEKLRSHLMKNPKAQLVTLVRLRCGSKVEVVDIDEPIRCEYSTLLTTPALCQEGRLNELQDNLEAVKMEQPQVRLNDAVTKECVVEMQCEFNITWLHRGDAILNVSSCEATQQHGGYCANQEVIFVFIKNFSSRDTKLDTKSRGLCLVPISCIAQVTSVMLSISILFFIIKRNLRKAAAQEVVNKVRQHNGLLVDQVYYPIFLSLVSAYCNILDELEVKNTWLSVDHMNQMLMIRKVDPTLDMEADEGDNYTHIPVRNRVG
ncbi:unnamed protein product [Lactuca saligna]|uniref:Glucosidase 2 subunit beta-like domain-containing protein n=1 Tax=Lactuca saligna TaxID=75948 RepID=A0AA36E6J7_LACSI|nr:unnamed protein product [Lactuca saligna]